MKELVVYFKVKTLKQQQDFVEMYNKHKRNIKDVQELIKKLEVNC